MNRTLLALSLLATLGLAAGACSKKSEKKAAPPAAAPKGTEATPPASPAPATAAQPAPAPTATADQAKPGDDENLDLSLADLGVAKCTEYVHKMNACLDNPNFPAATREAAKKPLVKAVQQWKQLPANARAGLSAACEQSLAKAKKAYGKIGCEF